MLMVKKYIKEVVNMFVIKLTGAFVTIAASTAIGFYFSLMFKERVKSMKELKKLLILLRGDIKFAATPLPEALEALAARHENEYTIFLEKLSMELKEQNGEVFFEIWKKCIEENLNSIPLNKKDKSGLLKFGENLGYLDKDMQINNIDLYLSQLENEIGESEKTLKDKTYLYNALGIMAGIFITIVII